MSCISCLTSKKLKENMKQPLAYIDPDAKIADNVVIEPFVTIDRNVVIGAGSRIRSNAVILSGTRIGENCTVFPGAVIGAEPQDLKFKGEDSLVIIGNNTTIRECATVHRGTASRGKTVIGDNCLISASANGYGILLYNTTDKEDLRFLCDTSIEELATIVSSPLFALIVALTPFSIVIISLPLPELITVSALSTTFFPILTVGSMCIFFIFAPKCCFLRYYMTRSASGRN